MSKKRSKGKGARKLYKRIKDKYYNCFYCGIDLERNKRTVDHLIPLAKGGLDIEENLVVSCKRCNRNKSDLTLDEFIELSLQGYFDPENVLKRNREKIHSPIVAKIKDEVEFVDKVVDIKDVSISSILLQPKVASIRLRRKHYLETGKFNKTAIAEEIILKNGKTVYRLRQGYINYLILKELKETTMELRVYKTNKSNKTNKTNKNNKNNKSNENNKE